MGVSPSANSAGTRAFAALQRALPQHALTRLVGRLAKSEQPLIRDTFIRTFARAYSISLAEARIESLAGFPTFNDFFTRALKDDARPIDADPTAFVSPADGTISQCGPIEDGTLLQAKGTRYRLDSLAGATVSARYRGGSFATVYLAPSNYHRYHLPTAAQLTQARGIPGALFSVNARTEAAISDLFCRNERLVCEFETPAGPMMLVMVGALIVGAIETRIGTPPSPYVQPFEMPQDRAFARGEELGQFLLGSTVIVCVGKDMVDWRDGLVAGTPVRMGETLGRLARR